VCAEDVCINGRPDHVKGRVIPFKNTEFEAKN